MNKCAVFLMLCLFILSGCNSSVAYLNDFENFISKLETDYTDYNEDEWIAAEERFDELSRDRLEKVRKNLTEVDMKRVNELIGKYRAIRIKKGFTDIKSGVKDVLQQGSAAIKGLLPDSAKVRDAIERGKSELEELLPDSLK